MTSFKVYLISDRRATAGRALVQCVSEALAGGVRMVQLREKDLSANELFELAVKLRALTKRHRAMLLINDRVDIARLIGADGVHLGVNGLNAKDARSILGNGSIIGVSAHSMNEAFSARAQGADFITFGPIFETASKKAYGAPVGIENLRKVCKKIKLPVYGLGGIGVDRIDTVIKAGAAGVAAISAILGAASVKKAAEQFVYKTTEAGH